MWVFLEVEEVYQTAFLNGLSHTNSRICAEDVKRPRLQFGRFTNREFKRDCASRRSLLFRIHRETFLVYQTAFLNGLPAWKLTTRCDLIVVRFSS